MKLPGRRKEGSAAEVGAAEGVAPVDTDVADPRTTAPKGRPTPKRGQGRRGPVTPAPMTPAEARARRKSLAGPKLSREERREQKALRRERVAENRTRMMAGEEAYLLPRDKGPVRRYIRDVVDARRNVLGLFLPSALVMLFVMMAMPLQVQAYMFPAMMGLMAIMLVDAVVLGRKVGKLVDAKFPENTERRWRLGLYAAGRASQLRRTRVPRPQVDRGATVD